MTIHPYYDGNGRTARLLTNLVLHEGGYGLEGLYSLEEYYAYNLGGYYEALTIGPHIIIISGEQKLILPHGLNIFAKGCSGL